MFENMLRELAGMGDEVTVQVPVSHDAEGYLDRECPAETCLFAFKVFGDDWSNLVRDEAVHCPMCRHEAPSDQWLTRAQVQEAQEFAFSHVKARLGDAMRMDARQQNASQRPGSFLNITMDVQGPPPDPMDPLSSTEPMRLRAACEACACRYSYIGSAFFCPACGHNSAAGTFGQSLGNARQAASIRERLAPALAPDDAENAARLLREKAAADIVMSVQRLAERVWEQLPAPKPAVKDNVFQRVDDASALWSAAVGRGFDSFLPPPDLARLKVHYQRRHLLSHREGIVDAKYLAKSGDTAFTIGQRITVDAAALLDFVDLAVRLGNGLMESLPAQPHGTAAEALPSAPTQAASAVAGPSCPGAETPRPLNRRGLSAHADAVAELLVSSSRHGQDMDPQLSPEEAFASTGLPVDDIVEAADELERAGLVRLHRFADSNPFRFYTATPLGGLFEVYDPVFGIGDPLADAKVVGQLLFVTDGRSAAPEDLAERLGWAPRRMNPAVWSLTCRGLADGSNTMGSGFDCVWLSARPGLRRFLAGSPA